jgi:hypothetical protein
MLSLSGEDGDPRVGAPWTLRCDALAGVIIFIACRDYRIRRLALFHPARERRKHIVLRIMIRRRLAK